MDETDNKKRRNLMFTACVVLASTFLGLKLPSALLTTLKMTAVATAWKVWALVALVLAYQLWRFWTDLAAIAQPSKAALENELLTLMNDALIRALVNDRKGDRHRGIQLDVPQHVSRPLIAKEFDVAGVQGGATANIDIQSLQGVAQFSWVETNDRGEGFANANCPYAFHRVLYCWLITRATIRAFLRSPAVQDGLVPIGLGLSALAIAVIRSVELWLAQ